LSQRSLVAEYEKLRVKGGLQNSGSQGDVEWLPFWRKIAFGSVSISCTKIFIWSTLKNTVQEGKIFNLMTSLVAKIPCRGVAKIL